MSNKNQTTNAADAMQSAITKLNHGQLVRVKGFNNRTDITVGTIAGYEEENVMKYSSDKSPAAIEAAKKEGIARAVKFWHSLAPWTNQAAGVIESDYKGKAEKLAKEQAARAAAPEIENGQTVEIEGALYTVRVAGERFSDPVHFVAKTAEEKAA